MLVVVVMSGGHGAEMEREAQTERRLVTAVSPEENTSSRLDLLCDNESRDGIGRYCSVDGVKSKSEWEGRKGHRRCRAKTTELNPPVSSRAPLLLPISTHQFSAFTTYRPPPPYPSNMPGGRPSKSLEEHRQFIETSIQVLGLTQEEIRDELFKSHGLKVGRSTLVKQLTKWSLRTRRVNFSDSPALRMRLQHFFHQTRLTDAEIASTLTENEGMDITSARVAKCRKEMGLYKRVDGEKKGAAETEVEELLRKEIEEDENVRNLGQKALYKHLRAKYNVTGRDRIFSIAKKLDPEGPERRLRAQRRGARRSGLRKEREAKEAAELAQARRQADGEEQQQQHGGDEERPQMEQQGEMAQYVPLDPAMYYGNYPAQAQQHQVVTAGPDRDVHQYSHDHEPHTSYHQRGETNENPAAQLQGYYASSQGQINGRSPEMHGHYAQGPAG